MNVAVICLEAYTQYGQRHERQVDSVILQRENETMKEFCDRIHAKVEQMTVPYSWYDWSLHEVMED